MILANALRKYNEKWYIYILLFVLIIVSSWVAWGYFGTWIADWMLRGQSADYAGSWGDSFGAFNALFSALAFGAVFATLLLQGRALSHQQRDQHRQRFESSFFELLHLMRELRSEIRFKHSLDYRSGSKSPASTKLRSRRLHRGEEAVTAAVAEMRYWIRIRRTRGANITSHEISDLYSKYVHKPHESRLGPFFRVVYTILRRLHDDNVLSESEKIFYGNLLRSQLSSHDVSLVAVNGLNPISKDLSTLLSKFRMLKYLPEGGTMRNTLKKVYPGSAFEPRD